MELSDKIKNELKERLRKIDPKDDFVLCVLANTGNVENWKRLLDFINKNQEEADKETILAYSVLIDDMTEKEKDEI